MCALRIGARRVIAVSSITGINTLMARPMTLRSAPGTYVLLIGVAAPQRISVGRLGTMALRPGTYAYAGSAFGSGGVRARVERHLRGTTSPHWHIDYLRPRGRMQHVWHTYDAARRECTWAEALRTMPGASAPLAGFGASDCGCPAHLVYVPRRPSLAAFRERVVQATGVHAPIHVHAVEPDRGVR
jgi:Uri superfamily endonuclease